MNMEVKHVNGEETGFRDEARPVWEVVDKYIEKNGQEKLQAR